MKIIFSQLCLQTLQRTRGTFQKTLRLKSCMKTKFALTEHKLFIYTLVKKKQTVFPARLSQVKVWNLYWENKTENHSCAFFIFSTDILWQPTLRTCERITKWGSVTGISFSYNLFFFGVQVFSKLTLVCSTANSFLDRYKDTLTLMHVLFYSFYFNHGNKKNSGICGAISLPRRISDTWS